LFKKFTEKMETVMAAAAFSEAGEFETARQIMKEDKSRKTDRPSRRNHKRPGARMQMRAD
jgi:hypothetical protein